MDEEYAADLEFLNKLFEDGNEQIRRTFDLYLELLDKYHALNNQGQEQDNGE